VVRHRADDIGVKSEAVLKGLITFGLTRRPLVLLGLLVFLGAGLFAFIRLNIEAYPTRPR
jgi:cobalt-zinc-cadmium resistance protein CzcA